uniref:DNA-directed RNA polymerase III subunit RPC4 n=1 Tax=Oryza punctata TaxID=4537 RepID=A0A0E0K0A9_ORYPU
MEIKEESKEYSVDNDMMLKMKLKTSQSMDVLGNEAETVFIKKNKAEAEKNESDVSTAKLPKGYVEPWDYNLNNYPITLPIRRPHSGDPAIRDEEEFGQSSSNRDHDGELTTAKELGLEDVAKPELLFFQLPLSFPLPRAEPVTEENTDINDDVNTEVTASDWSDQKRRHESIQGCRLEELPGGLMGKILVYNSGKLKMKLGDALFDVSAGMKCEFLQEVVAINTREKHFCSLGKIRKRLIVTPDIDYLLDI